MTPEIDIRQPLPAAVHDAVVDSLSSLLRDGEVVTTPAGKTWREIIGYSSGMSSPLHRILVPGAGTFDVVGAVSRFVWMMRGDEATSTIAYYVPRAAAYSPDGITLPGSNYGHRLRRGLPGVDQVRGVVHRLRTDPQTRQAATVVWNAMDAVREPVDVPCAMGTLYHVRGNALVATTIMRSNKPLTLMPFNFFEFSMLAEAIAAEVCVELGSYRHWIGAMQLPESEVPRAEAFVSMGAHSVEMPAMPRAEPLAQIGRLCLLEEEVRTAGTVEQVKSILAAADDDLHPYWAGLLRVLAVRWFVLHEHRGRDAVISELPDYLAMPLERRLAVTGGQP